MAKCNIVPDGEYDLVCTIHNKSALECARDESDRYKQVLLDIGKTFIRGDILVDDPSDKRGRILARIGQIIEKALFEPMLVEHPDKDRPDTV